MKITLSTFRNAMRIRSPRPNGPVALPILASGARSQHNAMKNREPYLMIWPRPGIGMALATALGDPLHSDGVSSTAIAFCCNLATTAL